MRRTLVALDLDGTLLTERSRIPQAHARAVRELQALGAIVTIVTGRQLMTSEWIWRELRLSAPMVCFNGAWIGVPGRTPMAGSPIVEHAARMAIAAARDLDATLCAYPDERTWLMDREAPYTLRWRDIYGIDIPVVPERFDDWRGHSWKLMAVADAARMRTLAPRLRARLAGRFHVVLSEPDRCEILTHGVTKATALERLARELGVERDDVWAVGDAPNDAEMIAWAGHGCAMGHAPEPLRALARHLLPAVSVRGLCALPALVARESR
jgi:Cof subfamily protein (haloacid dehalogenase superfamily)